MAERGRRVTRRRAVSEFLKARGLALESSSHGMALFETALRTRAFAAGGTRYLDRLGADHLGEFLAVRLQRNFTVRGLEVPKLMDEILEFALWADGLHGTSLEPAFAEVIALLRDELPRAIRLTDAVYVSGSVPAGQPVPAVLRFAQDEGYYEVTEIDESARPLVRAVSGNRPLPETGTYPRVGLKPEARALVRVGDLLCLAIAFDGNDWVVLSTGCAYPGAAKRWFFPGA